MASFLIFVGLLFLVLVCIFLALLFCFVLFFFGPFFNFSSHKRSFELWFVKRNKNIHQPRKRSSSLKGYLSYDLQRKRNKHLHQPRARTKTLSAKICYCKSCCSFPSKGSVEWSWPFARPLFLLVRLWAGFVFQSNAFTCARQVTVFMLSFPVITLIWT